MKNKALHSFLGFLIFFITCFVSISISCIIFMSVNRVSEGNLAVVIPIMLLDILLFSLLFTIVDIFRRKFMVVEPTEKILFATERIAKGDFTVRLTPRHSFDRYDEYDMIMDNINIVAKELGKSEILKSDFISNVSHEIKTPLAIIQNYTAMLRDETLECDTRKKYTDALISASKRLSSLVGNILKLNKLENQRIIPERKRVSLEDSIASSVISFEELIEEKELTLECDIEPISMITSEDYLDIVWNNLISNAIKFTDKGGRIAISLKEENGCAIFRITDTGIGIRDVGRHIFDKFYQEDTSHAKSGNGLGLALVKRVIDTLGGEIRVESTVGVGTTFTVVLREEIV